MTPSPLHLGSLLSLSSIISPACLAAPASILTEQRALLTQSEQALQQLIPQPEKLSERALFLRMPLLPAARQRSETLIAELEKELLDWEPRMKPYLPKESETQQLGSLEPSNSSPQETEIESSAGLYFDTLSSQLSYLGEVRLRDPRLRLHCSNGLFVQLEQQRVDSEVKNQGERHRPSEGKATPPPSKDDKAQPVPEPELRPASSSAPPIDVYAQQAYLDLHRERLFLRADREIILRHERGELRAEGSNCAAILLDKEGLFYLRADKISGYLVDEQGQRSHFHARGGILYQQQEDSITLLRDVKLSHEHYIFSSQGAMQLRLLPSPEQPAPREGYFETFQRSYEGLKQLGALDRVHLQQLATSSTAAQDSQPIEMSSDQLSYDALTGETILSGGSCELSNTQQTLHAHGDALIHWAVDGSLYIQASDIEGRYTRPVGDQGESLQGDFETKRELAFLADGKLFYAPHGLQSRDKESSLHASGALLASFTSRPEVGAEPEPREERLQLRTPPIIFNSLGELDTLYSVDRITAQHSGEPAFFLEGDLAAFSLQRGVGQLEAAAGETATLIYQGRKLTARSADQSSLIDLAPNGDLLVEGDAISMRAKHEGSDYELDCSEQLHLQRGEARLQLRRDIQLRTPDLLLKSPHVATIHLRRGAARDAKPQGTLSEQHPHLDYHFDSIDHIVIPRGSSLQTATLSMQHTDELQVHMADERKRPAHPSMQGVARLHAEGNVRLLFHSEDKQLLYARGDQLDVDGYKAEKILSGEEVYLTDNKNAHQARGKARLHLDAQNKVTLTGKQQRTRAENLQEQFKKKPKQNTQRKRR